MRTVIKVLPTGKLPAGVRCEQVHISGGDKAIVFTPAGAGNGAALLYMHGGGMAVGTAAQESTTLAGNASATPADHNPAHSGCSARCSTTAPQLDATSIQSSTGLAHEFLPVAPGSTQAQSRHTYVR